MRRAGTVLAAVILLAGPVCACASGDPAGLGHRSGPLPGTDPPTTDGPTTVVPTTDGSTTDGSTTVVPTTAPPLTAAPRATAPAPGDTAGPADAAEPGLGAGDPLFPGLGSSDIDVVAYDVSLRYEPDTDTLDGAVSIEAVVLVDASVVPLDATGLAISAASVEGAATSWTVEGDELLIDLPAVAAAGSHVSIGVEYAAPDGLTGSSGGLPVGWYDTADGSYVLNQPDGAHSWLPVSDHPSDKATWRFAVTVPNGTTAVANGQLVEEVAGGDRVTWIWEERHPMASYAILMLTGDYEIVRSGTVAGVDLVHAVLRSSSDVLDAYEEVTAEQLEFFTRWFGPYPFDSYGLAITESGFAGLAMETQGRSLFSVSDLDGSLGHVQHLLLSHELAHQWFGNAVTPARWSDLWLSEGFATYAEWMWLDDAGMQPLEAAAAGALRAQQHARFAVADPPAAELFGSGTYSGGAMVLHALRREVGDDAFFEILREWVARHGGGSATTDDFAAVASDVAGRDLGDFLAEWAEAADPPDAYPE